MAFPFHSRNACLARVGWIGRMGRSQGAIWRNGAGFS
jgi:hypothetical protein